MVEYSRITVPKSVHIGDPAGGYVETLKGRNSARRYLMEGHDKQAMQGYLKKLVTGSNLKKKEYSTVMSTGANEDSLEFLVKITWRTALPKCFDETMRQPSKMTAYLANPYVSTNLQERLMWCLVGIRRQEYEVTSDTKARE